MPSSSKYVSHKNAEKTAGCCRPQLRHFIARSTKAPFMPSRRPWRGAGDARMVPLRPGPCHHFLSVFRRLQLSFPKGKMKNLRKMDTFQKMVTIRPVVPRKNCDARKFGIPHKARPLAPTGLGSWRFPLTLLSSAPFRSLRAARRDGVLAGMEFALAGVGHWGERPVGPEATALGRRRPASKPKDREFRGLMRGKVSSYGPHHGFG